MPGLLNAYAPNPFAGVSAWNPADIGWTGMPTLPFPGTFSNGNRTVTRNTGVYFDPGVRGTVARGAAGQKWYIEFKVANLGTGTNVAYFVMGLRDGGALIGSDPVSVTGNYFVLHGNIGTCYKTGQLAAGTTGADIVLNDVISFHWEVGVDIEVRVNDIVLNTQAFLDVVSLFPYFGAGSTINGTDTTGTGESLILQSNALHQTYAPQAGFTPWG